MLRIRTTSIHLKFTLILLLTVVMIFAAGFITAHKLRTLLLRNTAQAVAEQVIAFRSWVAGSGVVWVDTLRTDAPDFLGRTNCGGASYYSKNPALATRELSNIVAQSGVNATFRVTSDNFRNANNRPDPFELSAVHTFKTNLVRRDPERFVESFEGRRYRYSIPIKVTEPCLKCHGSADDAPKEVVEKYGSLRAFGYKVGDIRGVITVDLPTVSLLSASPVTNVFSLTLIAAAILLNLFLLKKVVVDRIKKVTNITERMVHGEMELDLSGNYRKNSRDEIDKLYHALDLMRKSVKIAMDKLKR